MNLRAQNAAITAAHTMYAKTTQALLDAEQARQQALNVFMMTMQAHPAWQHYSDGLEFKDAQGNELKVHGKMVSHDPEPQIAIFCRTRVAGGKWSKSERRRVYVNPMAFIPDEEDKC